MTNAGTFDEWMCDTEVAIKLIQDVGEQIWRQKKYDSPHFSYERGDDSWIFKYNRVLSADEEIKSLQSHIQQTQTPHAIMSGGYVTIGPHSHGISNSTRTNPGINHIIIVIDGRYQITSIQWIRKPNTGLSLTSTYDPQFGSMHGGTVRASMLFLQNNKILINDKVYSSDDPSAFTNDISGENQHMRYLDILHFREKYNDRLF